MQYFHGQERGGTIGSGDGRFDSPGIPVTRESWLSEKITNLQITNLYAFVKKQCLCPEHLQILQIQLYKADKCILQDSQQCSAPTTSSMCTLEKLYQLWSPTKDRQEWCFEKRNGLSFGLYHLQS